MIERPVFQCEVSGVLALMLLVRPLNVWIDTAGSGLTPREKTFLSWMAPRGIVAAAIVSVFAIELAAFAMLVWYMARGARFSRGEISLGAGDRFPSFSLPDSHGELFDSASLDGKTALILFYRGPW